MGFLRANPALLAMLGFVAIATFVLGIFSIMRARAGSAMRLLAAGRTLLALRGPNSAWVTDRLASSGAIRPHQSDLSVSAEARGYWLYRPVVLIESTVLLVAIAVLWFFKGSAWAATIAPQSTASAQSADAVRQRLLAINALDAPFTVAAESPERIVVTWRFADARWVDLARVHGMRRTHRIILELDEVSRTVRPTEQQSSLDWSAGAQGGSLRWSTSMGIVFFQQEYQWVFGLQLDSTGRLVSQLLYSCRFNLQEMKAPLIQAVTGAGWRWRPVAWHGPSWLRWLTD